MTIINVYFLPINLSFVFYAQGNRHKAKCVKLFFSNARYVLPNAHSLKPKAKKLDFILRTNLKSNDL